MARIHLIRHASFDALGVSFEGLSPMRSLREALRFCLRQRDVALALAKPVLGEAPPA